MCYLQQYYNPFYLDSFKNEVYKILPIINKICGRSSGVERNLAKVEVEGSNPFARSNKSTKIILF